MEVVSFEGRGSTVLFRPLSMAIMHWNRALAVEAYFSNRCSVIAMQARLLKSFQCIPAGFWTRPEINCYMGHNVQVNRGCDKSKNWNSLASITTPQNIEAMRDSTLQSPRRSARRHASVRDLKSRRNIYEAFLGTVFGDGIVVFSDEVHFHLNGSINRQNIHYWAETNPRILHQRFLQSPKITVWCAASSAGIVAPWFFEENEFTVTVNSGWYVKNVARLDELDLGDIWFQTNGATAHTLTTSIDVLREHPERLISIRGNL